ncbi:MAG: DUF1028 domain-containing protein [Actinomycetota bacterium]
MTFSIVAWDRDAGPEWGVAVASKFLGVGALVPWARAGAGALATQAFANLSYGPGGIERLSRGETAAEVVDALTSADPKREHRQLGVVDSTGGVSTFTGSSCMEWAGGIGGMSYCCQGNILMGPEVVEAMSRAFEGGSGDLATRLLAALSAGDTAGGDRRGKQSAAVLVVRPGGGYGRGTDRAVDLRVDDHAEPVAELERLLDRHRLHFPRREELDFVAVDESLAQELRVLLAAIGRDPGAGSGYDNRLVRALLEFVGTENLEERWNEGPRVERGVLRYLRDQAGGRPT